MRRKKPDRSRFEAIAPDLLESRKMNNVRLFSNLCSAGRGGTI